MKLKVLAIGMVLVAFSASAFGAGNLVDGNSTVNIVGTPFSGTLGNANWFTDTGASDQLFYYSWGYRVPFNNQNSQMSRLVSPTESYVGNSATLSWLNNGPGTVASNSRFDFVLNLKLTDGAGPNIGNIDATASITNINPVPLTIEIFNQVDFDIGSVVTDDNGTITNASEVRYRQSDAGGSPFGEALASGAGRYQVGTGTTIRNLVNNSTSVNLNNTASVLSSDAAAAFQWSLTLQPGETRVLYSGISLNSAATPEPAALAMLGLAAIAMIRHRR